MRDRPTANATTMEAAGNGHKGLWKPVVFVLAIVAVFAAAEALNLGEKIGDFRGWIESLGPWGPGVFILAGTAAIAMALPVTIVTVAAGALFGTFRGTLCGLAASTLGAAAGFLIARYLAREALSVWLAESKRFKRLNRLTRTFGPVVVGVSRLIPLTPYFLINYIFGLTEVRFGTYLVWSFLAMIPNTLLFVAGGDAATDFITEGRVEWPVIVSGAITAVLLLILMRYAQKKIRLEKAEKALKNGGT